MYDNEKIINGNFIWLSLSLSPQNLLEDSENWTAFMLKSGEKKCQQLAKSATSISKMWLTA